MEKSHEDPTGWVLKLRQDHHAVGLPAKEVAMLDFAVKITAESFECTAADIQGLRDLGWTDREILDTVLVSAYRNFIARVAAALGADPEGDFQFAPEAIRAIARDLRHG